MLSVAQAVRHPETPGSASKHSILGHSWSSERPNGLKRRKTDPEYVDNVKFDMACVDVSSQHLLFNNAEITLTPIRKNNPNIKDLLRGKISTPLKGDKRRQAAINKHEEENSNEILDKVPPEYRSILANNEEIQLTTLKKICNHQIDETAETLAVDKTAQQDEQNFTIAVQPSISSNPKKSARTLAKLAKAQDFLKKNESSKRPEINLNVTQPRNTYNNNSTVNKSKRASSPVIVDDQLDEAAQEFADYEPFNIGIPCETYYSNNKDRPYYTTGFPNPAGENRCWTNATLQALFALPLLNKLDSLHFPEPSKLMSSLVNVQKSWRKGITSRYAFDNVFSTFKDELSILDELYTSKAQQDVSEFVMNLFNFISSEFEALIKKNSHQNEIENIPNNEQDSLSKSLNSLHDANKRLPLSDISATAGQVKSRCTLNTQESNAEIKNNTEIKSINENEMEKCRNPIDEYFSSYMMEKYICDCCLKQRSQKVENLMLFIDLPAEDHGNTINLIDMINKTFAKEQRSMTCESCKHDVHTMESKFKKLPKILIVQVKRYEMTNEGMLTKKSTSVDVPRLLKLDTLVINNCQDSENTTEFEPMCIVSHIGDSINSGHYISFVKHQDQWFYYDDMNVTILSADEVFKNIQNNAYVIFFKDTKLNQFTDSIDEQIEKDVC